MSRRMLAGALAAVAACATSPQLNLGASPAGVTVDARIQYYDVTAGSVAEVRRAIATEGPRGAEGRRWAAVTSWRLQWTYRLERRNSGCDLDRTHVRVTTVITFPRWSPMSQPDSALTEWWYQYNAGLAEHERGHAQLAVKAAGDIVRELNGLSGGACDALGTRANEVGTRVSQAMQIQQARYDADTRHGAAQILQATRLQAPETFTSSIICGRVCASWGRSTSCFVGIGLPECPRAPFDKFVPRG